MGRPNKKNVPKPTITRLGVLVESSDVRVEADINYDAKLPQYAIRLNEQDPVYKYVTRLVLRGAVTYPPERAGDRYEVSISGDDSPSKEVSPTLRQLQERDEHGSPKYREYRGGHIPVYKPVAGFGLVDKVRGEPAWSGWINIQGRLVSDMLVLLSSGRRLYLAIEERRLGRTRWIDGVGLQTTDPADE